VFQFHHLLPEFTAIENISIPGWIGKKDKKEVAKKAIELLDYLGLADKQDKKPHQLSGGEQQRVSIARAVAQDPIILFADEPTANLDSASSANIVEVLMDLNRKGQTIVMVTHEKEYTHHCNRIIFLEDGKIIREEKLR
jgi:lipoprotein-releasing system ATP-binding protein